MVKAQIIDKHNHNHSVFPEPFEIGDEYYRFNLVYMNATQMMRFIAASTHDIYQAMVFEDYAENYNQQDKRYMIFIHE